MTVLTKNACTEEVRVLCVAINSGKMANFRERTSEVNTKMMKYPMHSWNGEQNGQILSYLEFKALSKAGIDKI